MAFNYYQPMAYQTGYNPTPVGYNPSPTASYGNTGIVWVDGYDAAAMYPIAPNAAVALWDKSSPSIYLKRADATGKPSMQIYDLVERKETPKPATATDVRYATQEALERLAGVVDGLREGLEEIRLKTNPTALNGEGKSNER